MSAGVRANAVPVFEGLVNREVTLGGQFEFILRPVDSDGDIPGQYVERLPEGATSTDNFDGTRTFRWTPTASDVGDTMMMFFAIDARDPNVRSSKIIRLRTLPADSADNSRSNSGNTAPVFDQLRDLQIQLGGRFEFPLRPVDADGDVPGQYVENLPDGAVSEDNFDGSRTFRWTPNANDIGQTSVTFFAIDARDPQLRTSKTINLVVTEADGSQPPSGARNSGNTPPQFSNLQDQQVALGQQFDFVVKPVDVDGDIPGQFVSKMPAGATTVDNFDGTRSFRWRPLPRDLGDTRVTFNAVDARDPFLRTAKTITLRTVRDPDNPVNFPPVINGISDPIIRAGDTLNLRVKPIDPDMNVPRLEVLNPPAGAQFINSSDDTKTLRWLTDDSNIGETSVTFRATDVADSSSQVESTVRIKVVERNSRKRSGRRLRDLANERNFLVGYAHALQASAFADNQLYRDVAREEFNILTPENSHKMSYIHPERGVFRWEDADEIAAFAAQNGMKLHGHPLVWYAQLPPWVLELDPSQAESVMVEHIVALASRYRGRVAIWDVVNEALEDDGSLRDSIWHQGMGDRYIRKAFETARASDPDAVLLYNDYDVFSKNVKSDAMYELLKRELAAGTPIDGVGFQVHLRTGFNEFGSVAANLQRFADLGLDIYITEFDVSIDGNAGEQRQADMFRQAMEICLAQSRCKAMQAWGFTDRYSWRSVYNPLMLDDEYLAKPAYRAWQDTLQNFFR